MSHINTALILYPNQLFAPELLPVADVILLVEEPLFFGRDPDRPLSLHKQKLLLHRASMRRYVEEVLWQSDLNVEYIEIGELEYSADVLIRAQKAGAEVAMIFDPTDHLLESNLKKALDESVKTPFELRVLPNPSFMLKRGEVRDYFSYKTKHKFGDFYQWQRERFNILIDSKYKPTGGKWQFESTKHPALPEGQIPPGFNAYGDNQYVNEAKKWVDKFFGDNPGNCDNFFWPTTHQEASDWLDEFIKSRLNDFALYEEALDNQAVLLYHSGLSAMLNCGLLTPKQVIDRLVAKNSKNPIDMAALENFIRQIIGWREYIRGIYVTQNIANFPTNSQSGRLLHNSWWESNTGIPPLDDAVKKLQAHAYATSAERKMIFGNLMLLCDIDKSEIYKWYSSMFIDAYDWVLTPNIYAMTNLSTMGGMVNGPFISDCESILQKSHYQRDVWCDIWDGLFWAYIDKHRAALANNPLTSHMVNGLDKISAEQRRIIGYRAQDFITSIS